MTQATKPVCRQPGCGQEIWYKPDEYDECAGCRKRGGPPPEPPPPPEPAPKWYELDPELKCATPDCFYASSNNPRTGRHCMKCFLAQHPELRGAPLWKDPVHGYTYDLDGDGNVVVHCMACMTMFRVAPGEFAQILDADKQPNCDCRR